MTILRFAPALIAALGLSACAVTPEPSALSRYADGLGGDAPLASLPAAAGRVVAVRRTAYANGSSQQIVLDGPRTMVGENRITIQASTVDGRGAAGARGDALNIAPPTDAAIAAEMETQFPGLRMQVATDVERNALGPFGYAVGSKGLLTCLYAWQYVAPTRPLSLIDGVSGIGAGPISVRVRLCRDRPAAALVEDIRRLSPTRSGAGVGPVGGAVTGDALEAAIGPLTAASPSRAAAVSSEGPSVDEPVGADPATGAPPPRRAARPAARHMGRRDRPRPRAHPVRRDASRDEARREASAAVPRVPLPSSVGTDPVPASPRPGASPRPSPSASPDGDAMPLPH